MNHEACASAGPLYAAGDTNERFPVLEAKHKIFLSHSGAQKSFVAYLDDALRRRDQYPFFDRKRSCLPIGDEFPKLIFDAIGQCDVGVVVLSEEFFTRSKWPMLELVAMVEESKKPNRRIKIIPVFYGISREECRDPSIQAKWMNDYWIKWEGEDNKGRINLGKWKSALEIFGSTTGLNMKAGMLDLDLQTEIVEEICKDVLPEMRWDDSKVEGKIRLCQEICREVYKGFQPKDLTDGVRKVGLYGVGGIGKTTACKILCNALCRDYCNRVCHVEFGSECELELLRKALRKLSILDGERLDKISNVEVCHHYLRTRIVRERVFLALDNVSDEFKKQANHYLEAELGDGSVVLVTARSVDQLLRLGVERKDCFAMPDLELEEAKSLFLSHVGVEKNKVDEVLMEKCVKRCYFGKGQSSSSSDDRHYHSSDDRHYHPLALRVLGSEVGELIQEGDEKTLATLLIKIETFNLSRQKEDPVFSILRSSFDSLLEEDQLLFMYVAVSSPKLSSIVGWKEWLGMVDENAAKDIEMRLRCLKRRSLLESFREHAYDFSMHDLWREFAAVEIKGGKFKDLFEVTECHGVVDLIRFPEVRVVKWIRDYYGSETTLHVRGLKQLKSLDGRLSYCSVFKVHGLGTLQNLSYLGLSSVLSSACIAELERLTNLQVLVLRDFRGDRLPDMSKLAKLRKLDLDSSMNLQRVSPRNLTNLTDLHLAYCPSLQSVNISGCRSMRKLVGLEDGTTFELEEINVSCCPLLPSLDKLWRLRKLRKLDITGCSSIRELKGLGVLDALEELRAMHCDSLTSLPSCRLPKLRVLDIEPLKVPPGFQWNFKEKLSMELLALDIHNSCTWIEMSLLLLLLYYV